MQSSPPPEPEPAGTQQQVEMPEGREEEGEEEMVMVAGVPKPLSEVTEEDQERMTEAEHTVFFNLCQQLY